MTRRYYAATLIALNGEEPLVIDEVFVFTDFSLRREWIFEGKREDSVRVPLKAVIGRNHQRQVDVTFGQHTHIDGEKAWVWFYNGFPQ